MTTKGPSSDTLQLRRGTAAEWTASDPVLSAGEVGWERDTNKVKIGDGATAWTSLPYLAGTGVGADHGLLTGLGDDDHPQYASLAQNESIAGTWDFPATGFTVGSDTNLYRSSANILKTDDVFFVKLDFYARADGEYVGVGLMGPGGETGLVFGSAEDTNLYRSAANVLKTDDTFDVGGTAKITPSDGTLWGAFLTNYANSGPYLSMAAGAIVAQNQVNATNVSLVARGMPAQSGNLQEWQNDTTATLARIGSSGRFATTSYVEAKFGGANAVVLGYDGAGDAAAISFGSAYDVNLYRLTANILTTDDEMRVKRTSATDPAFTAQYTTGTVDATFYIEAGGKHWWQDGVGSSWDTNLYRASANTLKTDDNFESLSLTMTGDLKTTADVYARFGVAGDTRMGALGPSSEAGFLIGGDVNLYRSAANILKTDDQFQIGAGLYVGGHSNTVGAYINPQTSPTYTLALKADPSAYHLVVQNSGGTHVMGIGPTGIIDWASDTNLYRLAADILKTDDSFQVGSGVKFIAAAGGLVSTRYITAYDNVGPYADFGVDAGGTTTGLTVFNRTTIGNVPFTVTGMASQTGDLQRWTNSTPTTLAGITATGALDMLEQTAPAAPAANTGRVFFQDDGSGKTQAVVRFPSGASQIFATEP